MTHDTNQFKGGAMITDKDVANYLAPNLLGRGGCMITDKDVANYNLVLGA